MRNSSDPAFPVDGIHASDALKHYTSGLTKREYFAGLAMQGMLANSAEQNFLNQHPYSHMTQEEIVILAVSIADELLKQLDNEPTEPAL